MQLEGLLSKDNAQRAAKASAASEEKSLKAETPARKWNRRKDSAPSIECFPKELRRGWRYVPDAHKNAQNLVLLFHGLGDTSGMLFYL